MQAIRIFKMGHENGAVAVEDGKVLAFGSGFTMIEEAQRAGYPVEPEHVLQSVINSMKGSHSARHGDLSEDEISQLEPFEGAASTSEVKMAEDDQEEDEVGAMRKYRRPAVQ